jgi:ATP-dependent Clp protease ATP-binding subunit ClpA
MMSSTHASSEKWQHIELKRVMRKEVENRVARALLDGSIRDGETVEITVHDGKLVIEPIVTALQASEKT